MRKILLVTIAIVICAAGLITFSQSDEKKAVYKPSHPVRNIPELAADAKSKGIAEIIAPPAIIEYPTMPSADVLFSRFTVAAVQVRTIQPHYEGKYQVQIVSDVTLNILQVLSSKENQRESANVPMPSSITVTVHGGTILENEVKVTQRSRFPVLMPNQNFIVILDSRLVDDKSRYYLPFGPDSIIALDSDNKLQSSPWIHSEVLKKFLEENSISSLSDFQVKVQAARRSQ